MKTESKMIYIRAVSGIRCISLGRVILTVVPFLSVLSKEIVFLP
jgi:hypothetical protein